MIHTYTELRDYLIENLDKDELNGVRFKWCIPNGEVYTYGWCTQNDDFKAYTNQITTAKKLNFFSFSIGTRDIKATTKAEIRIDSLFLIKTDDSQKKNFDILLETIGTANPFSKNISYELIPGQKISSAGTSVSFYAEGSISYIGAGRAKKINDRFDLL
jgi:hypothetical protein